LAFVFALAIGTAKRIKKPVAMPLRASKRVFYYSLANKRFSLFVE